MSPLLLAAVIRQESSYNSNARSPTGAVGLTQIIPSYWQQTCAGIYMMKVLISNVGLIF